MQGEELSRCEVHVRVTVMPQSIKRKKNVIFLGNNGKRFLLASFLLSLAGSVPFLPKGNDDGLVFVVYGHAILKTI